MLASQPANNICGIQSSYWIMACRVRYLHAATFIYLTKGSRMSFILRKKINTPPIVLTQTELTVKNYKPKVKLVKPKLPPLPLPNGNNRWRSKTEPYLTIPWPHPDQAELDLTGLRFGRYKVIGFAGYQSSKSRWVVRCRCGVYEMWKRKHILKFKSDARCIGCEERRKRILLTGLVVMLLFKPPIKSKRTLPCFAATSEGGGL